jgi:hypothetical protein
MDEELGQHPSTSSVTPDRRKASSIITRAPSPTEAWTASAETAAWLRRVSTSRSGEVRRGVDEGTVEVEHDGGIP